MASTSEAASLAAVHMRITPPPRSIDTTRQILRALQRYGEVVAFRSLRNEHPTPRPRDAVAVFTRHSSALSLVNEGPIRLTLEPKRHSAAVQPARPETTDAQVHGNTTPSKTAARNGENGVPLQVQREPLQVTITPKHSDFNYRSLISNGPYHGPFTPDLRSMQSFDLKTTGAHHRGLRDWIGAAGKEKRTGSDQEIRLLRKKRDELRERRLDLRDIWEEGMRRRQEAAQGKSDKIEDPA